MPYKAEFSTDGRKRMLDSGEARDDDPNAVENFIDQAIRMADESGSPVHLQVLQNGKVVISTSYGTRNASRP